VCKQLHPLIRNCLSTTPAPQERSRSDIAVPLNAPLSAEQVWGVNGALKTMLSSSHLITVTLWSGFFQGYPWVQHAEHALYTWDATHTRCNQVRKAPEILSAAVLVAALPQAHGGTEWYV
jgi:hypothetical protein